MRDSHFPKRLTTSRGVEELLLSCLFVCIYVRWLVSLSLSPAMGRAGSARHHTFISHLAERLASCNTNANGATALAVRIGSCLVSRRSRFDFYAPPSTFPQHSSVDGKDHGYPDAQRRAATSFLFFPHTANMIHAVRVHVRSQYRFPAVSDLEKGERLYTRRGSPRDEPLHTPRCTFVKGRHGH